MIQERCQDCYYFSTNTITCDYCHIAGHTRGGPISECMVFRPKDKPHPMRGYMPGAKKQRDRDRISLRDAAMLELYNQGYTDRAIAAELSCGCTTVRNWRHQTGLCSQKERQEVVRTKKE